MPAAAVIAGGTIVGAYLTSEANKHAADTQAASGQQSLAFLKDVYQQRRQDLGNTIALGGGASAKLAGLYGINVPSNAPQPTVPYNGQSPTTPTGGQNLDPGSVQKYQPIVPGSTSVSLTYAGGAPPSANMGMVTIKAPTGETRQVPANLAEFYQGKGAQIVSA